MSLLDICNVTMQTEMCSSRQQTCAKSLSPVWFFVTLQTGAHQVLLAIGFSRQEYWSGLPFPFPGDLPEPGIEPSSLASPTLAGRDSLPLSHLGSPHNTYWTSKTKKEQTNLREITGSVPDQHNKVDIARELDEFFGFPVHLKVIYTLYHSLVSV